MGCAPRVEDGVGGYEKLDEPPGAGLRSYGGRGVGAVHASLRAK